MEATAGRRVVTVLAGRRALVTGAAAGLGLAFARALSEAGAAVAVCDVDPAVEQAAAGIGAWYARVDVSDPGQVRDFVAEAAARLDGIDIVVNNAAVCIPTDPAADPFDKAVADYQATVGTNLGGSFLVGRAAIPHLARHGGDLVNVTTDHIHTCGWPVPLDHAGAPGCPWAEAPRPPGGGPAFDLYDASKWALQGLTSAWARALRSSRVRVNSFGMGATDTPMYRGFLGGRPPAPGMMSPEAVAGVLVDLIAEGPEGRTGDSVQLWVGHPCVLPPPAGPPVAV